MLRIKDNVKLITVIMGTLVGAGFSSGKEIDNFFVVFGKNGILGICISVVLTGVIIYNTLKISIDNKIEDNEEFVEKIKGGSILYGIINIFLIISFYIMIAGFSSFLKQCYNIPICISSIIIGIAIYFVLINKDKGIIKMNTFIIPILLVIISAISMKYVLHNDKNIHFYNSKNVIKSVLNAILYASYNSITLIPILVVLKNHIKSKKEIIFVTITTCLLITIILFSIFLLLNNHKIKHLDLPVLEIVNTSPDKELYGLAIAIAIFTSAISSGYGVLENVKKEKSGNKYKFIVLIMCIIGIPISYIGFGRLVSNLYPIFGILGMLEIFKICSFKQNNL